MQRCCYKPNFWNFHQSQSYSVQIGKVLQQMQQPSIATIDNNNVMNTKILEEQENLKGHT